MIQPVDHGLVDQSVSYMERTRLYYRALGYKRDYVWAHFETVPFTPLATPLSETRIAVITTSSPPGPWDAENKPPKRVWSGETAAPPEALYTGNLAWDKETTHTRDRESYLPLAALAALAGAGTIGGLTDHFFGVPTEYSHRKTLEEDAPELLRRCRGDGADAAILVAL